MFRTLIILAALLLSPVVGATEKFGTVDAVSGEATVTDSSATEQRVVQGMALYVGQTVQTAADGEVHIVSIDSGLIALRPGSHMRIDRYQAKGEDSDEIALSLLKGAMRSITGWIAKKKSAAYRLHTPSATIGVRGTDHETTVLDSGQDGELPGTFDKVIEGITVMQTQQGEIEVRPGQFAFAPHEAGAMPRLLDRTPGFDKTRSLKMEQRIQQQKEKLAQHIRQRIADLPQTKQDRADKNQAKRRETLKQRNEQNRPRERHTP